MADKYDRSLMLSPLAQSPFVQAAKSPTVSSFSRYVARDVSRFHPWFPIRFCDTTPRQSATYASYPNVRTRAVGSSHGRRVLGHGSLRPSAGSGRIVAFRRRGQVLVAVPSGSDPLFSCGVRTVGLLSGSLFLDPFLRHLATRLCHVA